MSPPPSRSGPQGRGRRPRQRQGSRRRKNDRAAPPSSSSSAAAAAAAGLVPNGGTRRIIRARRPPSGGCGTATTTAATASSPTSVVASDDGFAEFRSGDVIDYFEEKEAARRTAYEEAVAAATATLRAPSDDDGSRAIGEMVGEGAIVGNDDSNVNSFQVRGAGGDSRGDAVESADSAEGVVEGSDSNHIEIPMVDESGGDESESDRNSLDENEIRRVFFPRSNRFNALIEDESSSGGSGEYESDSDISDLPSLEDIVACSKIEKSNARVASDAEDEAGKNDDDDSADDSIPKCAVCFLEDDQSHPWRRLVTLPCCGADGREESSSTRFCAACVLRMATTAAGGEYAPWDEERSDPPANRFYEEDRRRTAEGGRRRRLVECPRCRDILAVDVERRSSSDAEDDDADDDDYDGDESSACDCSDCRPNGAGDWTNPETARSIAVKIPSFEDRCRYAGRKVGVARILWKAAFLRHSFMPREALGREDEKPNLSRLVTWGILHRVPVKKGSEDLYRMDRGRHAELIDLFDLRGADGAEGLLGYVRTIRLTEEVPRDDLILDLLAGVACSGLTFLRELRPVRFCRTVDRFGLLFLFFKGQLPLFPLSTWQEWTVTALNLFAVAMVLQFVCIVVLYAASFFGVSLTVCYLLKRSSDRKSRWWLLPLGSYFAYRLARLVYDSPCISLYGTVAPKAAFAIKEFIWG